MCEGRDKKSNGSSQYGSRVIILTSLYENTKIVLRTVYLRNETLVGETAIDTWLFSKS